VAAVPLSLASGVPATAVHLTAIAAASLYNFGLKSTPLSFVPYGLAFALLPEFVTLGLPGAAAHLAPGWALAAGALIGAGGHFTQALPDIETDRREGIHGLPQAIGERASALASALLLAAAAGTIALGTSRAAPALVTVPLAIAVAAAGLSGGKKTAFRLTLLAAAATVGAFLLSGQSLADQ
jgi:protoheme IX farnesyltransferase